MRLVLYFLCTTQNYNKRVNNIMKYFRSQAHFISRQTDPEHSYSLKVVIVVTSWRKVTGLCPSVTITTPLPVRAEEGRGFVYLRWALPLHVQVFIPQDLLKPPADRAVDWPGSICKVYFPRQHESLFHADFYLRLNSMWLTTNKIHY